LSWWKRFKPNQATLPTALLATALCGVGLLLVWTGEDDSEAAINRYGDALAQALAHANAGRLLHQDRIELTLIASQINRFEEVAGVVFYSAANEIVALSGSTEHGQHFTASAALDDTITGYVSVVVASQAFAPEPRYAAWLLTLGILAASPFLTLGFLQLSARGNRSLPIVSVPDSPAAAPRPSFALAINLHNQMALNRAQRDNAVADAMNMAQEVCAIHPGIAVAAPERGAVILFDQDVAGAGNAVCAAFLTARLMQEFETDGEFRFYLDVTDSPGAPGELEQLSYEQLLESTDIDNLLTLAALAKAQSVLIASAVYANLSDQEKGWAEPFEHPLLEDIATQAETYSVSELPDQQAELVDNQARLILGFTPH
jgi:hypothetical protein